MPSSVPDTLSFLACLWTARHADSFVLVIPEPQVPGHAGRLLRLVRVARPAQGRHVRTAGRERLLRDSGMATAGGWGVRIQSLVTASVGRGYVSGIFWTTFHDLACGHASPERRASVGEGCPSDRLTDGCGCCMCRATRFPMTGASTVD
jgi:hypothetical protein